MDRQYADTSWIKTEADLAKYIWTEDAGAPIEPGELERLLDLISHGKPGTNSRDNGLWAAICAAVEKSAKEGYPLLGPSEP